jgi:hypothetical protein
MQWNITTVQATQFTWKQRCNTIKVLTTRSTCYVGRALWSPLLHAQSMSSFLISSPPATFGEDHRRWSSSSCNYLQYNYSSFVLDPNIVLSTRSWCYFYVKDRFVVNISYAYGEWGHSEQTDKEGGLERGQLSSLRHKLHLHCRHGSQLPPVTGVKITHQFYLCSLTELAVASPTDVTS